MTKKDALTIALSTLTASTYTNPSFDGKDTTRKEIPVEEVREVITKMIAQLSKTRNVSDEKKAEQSAKRKAATAAARAEMTTQVIPILRDVITTDMTAKEIYEAAADRLPADFSAPKVQNILRREMAAELVVTEAKGKPNTYRKV